MVSTTGGGEYFDGDTIGPRVSPATARLERSDDDGRTWATVADQLDPGGGADDHRAPLNRHVLYRAIAISALGVETASDPVEAHTPSGDAWLEGEDGRRARIRTNLKLGKSWGHEAIAVAYYGQDYPTSHYGRALSDRVTITGTLAAGEDLEQDLASLLRRQDVFLRDPRGAAWWAQLAGDYTDDSDWIERAEVSIPLTRVMGADDDA